MNRLYSKLHNQSGFTHTPTRSSQDAKAKSLRFFDGNLDKKLLVRGFTLMEIIVATAVFAMITAGLTGLFSYTLRINRKSEALRQATQGMRNLVELLTKEVRNGKIDYGVVNGTSLNTSMSPCPLPGAVGSNTYGNKGTVLGIINPEGKRECFYYSYNDAARTPASGYEIIGTSNPGTLALKKEGVSTTEVLTPSNVRIEELVFFVRPLCDPYSNNCSSYGTSYPKIQPSVTMAIKFVSQLPTGEQVPIYYQTSISGDKYDIPSM